MAVLTELTSEDIKNLNYKKETGKSIVMTFNDCNTNTVKNIMTKQIEKCLSIEKIKMTQDGMKVEADLKKLINRLIGNYFKVIDIQKYGKKVAKDDASAMVLQFVDGMSGVASNQVVSVFDGKSKFYVWGYNGLYEVSLLDFIDWFFEKLDDIYGLREVSVRKSISWQF